MSEGPKVVKKKKKWGKVYTYTPIKRSPVLSKEQAAEIEKDLNKPYVTTATQFAQKHSITVGLAKKILRDAAENGKFTEAHKTAKNEIYQ